MRLARPVRLVLWCAALAGTSVRAAEAAPSTGTCDPRDALLLERAVRVGRNTATRHLTPEGLLAYVHRRDATPAELSADATKRADTGMWTGAYAASLACRYHVTKEPEALALCRRVASGLELLSTATGVEGCISRAVGRPLPGEAPGTDVVASPLGGGLVYRNDPSRDALTGIVFGWVCLARFCDDADVQALARRNLGAIARRLVAGKMQLRDVDGRVTKHGELSPKAVVVFENGMHAAIGLAAVLGGVIHDGGPDLLRAWKRLDHDGWVDALDAQWTWLPAKVTDASNMNMSQMALTVVALEDLGKSRRLARSALRDFRRKTAGRQNGGYLAMYLLSGNAVYRQEVVEELRETLLRMPAGEIPSIDSVVVEGQGFVPIERRPVETWAWKSEPDREETLLPSSRPDPARTFTRADWLFAYWLARAADELSPR